MAVGGCDHVEKNLQALFRGERSVILAIRLLGFRKGVKHLDYLFHPPSITASRGDARNYFD
jgi:hypothetical protein